MFPTMMPTTISISATEMPTRIEIRLAMKASPIQIAAIYQIFSVFSVTKFLSRLRGRIFGGAIMNDLHYFERDESAGHHLVERRQKVIDVVLAVHDLDDERQIH